jgi:hypothetical protein
VALADHFGERTNGLMPNTSVRNMPENCNGRNERPEMQGRQPMSDLETNIATREAFGAAFAFVGTGTNDGPFPGHHGTGRTIEGRMNA